MRQVGPHEQGPGALERGQDLLVEVLTRVVFDKRLGIDADRRGDLLTQGVGNFLGLGSRAEDANEPSRIAAAARQTARLLPAVAEPYKAVDSRPVGAVEQPEIGRRPVSGKINVDLAASSSGRPAPEWPQR